MARPDRSPEINALLLHHVAQHPNDLVATVAKALGLSRARIAMQVRELVATGYLTKEGTTRPTYRLASLPAIPAPCWPKTRSGTKTYCRC
jgi:DNA-binding IclR family transcriptional regulator